MLPMRQVRIYCNQHGLLARQYSENDDPSDGTLIAYSLIGDCPEEAQRVLTTAKEASEEMVPNLPLLITPDAVEYIVGLLH